MAEQMEFVFWPFHLSFVQSFFFNTPPPPHTHMHTERDHLWSLRQALQIYIMECFLKVKEIHKQNQVHQLDWSAAI